MQKGKMRFLAPDKYVAKGDRDDVCVCIADRKLVKVKAQFTGDHERIACVTCRKWFRP